MSSGVRILIGLSSSGPGDGVMSMTGDGTVSGTGDGVRGMMRADCSASETVSKGRCYLFLLICRPTARAVLEIECCKPLAVGVYITCVSVRKCFGTEWSLLCNVNSVSVSIAISI